MSSLPAPITTASDQPPVWGWVRVRALVIDSVSSAAFPARLHDRPRRFPALVGAIRAQNLYPRNRSAVSRAPGVARHVGVSGKSCI